MSADGAQEGVLVDSPGQDDSPLWTRDGRFLLFRSDRSGKWDLYAIRMRDGRPTDEEMILKSNLGAESFLQGVTTEGRLFVHEMVGGRDVALMERIDEPAATTHARTLPRMQTTENKSPAFAPDGRSVAYLAGPPGGDLAVRITDLAGKILKDMPLGSGFSAYDPPRFSPDGERLALRAYEAGEAKIMVLSVETEAPLRVFSFLEEEGYARPLGWSRDGRLLYTFVTFFAGDRSLAAIDVETEELVETTVLSDDVGRVSLSPSGDHLLMLASSEGPAGRGRETRLVLRSLDDGNEKLLREGVSFRFGWDWDSRHVFYEKDDGNDRLYVFSIDTGEEAVLVDDMGGLDLVSVSPDGKYWALHNGPAERDSRIWVLENFLPESTERVAAR